MGRETVFVVLIRRSQYAHYLCYLLAVGIRLLSGNELFRSRGTLHRRMSYGYCLGVVKLLTDLLVVIPTDERGRRLRHISSFESNTEISAYISEVSASSVSSLEITSASGEQLQDGEKCENPTPVSSVAIAPTFRTHPPCSKSNTKRCGQFLP